MPQHCDRSCRLHSFVLALFYAVAAALFLFDRCHAFVGSPCTRRRRFRISRTHHSGPGADGDVSAPPRIRSMHVASNADLESLSKREEEVKEDASSFATRLIERGRQELSRYFEFSLDGWQLQAGGAIVEGYNVIVSSPTGSGKTVVGEMALHTAFADPQKTGIYTTPLKALSNQKYMEFSALFGRSNTGLSTGDVSINKGARVTVMTTEVYRNIAWRSSIPATASLMARRSELEQNAVIVMDEFHYMGYPGRGGVWEECVITSPAHTQIVGLSATLSNAKELASWMQSVTDRKTVLIEVPSSERPVPLRYLYATKEGLYPLFRDPDAGPGAPKGLLGYRGDGIAPVQTTRNKKKKEGFGKATDDGGDYNEPLATKLPKGLQVNPALKQAAARRMDRVNRSIERQKLRDTFRSQDQEDEWGMRRQRYQYGKKLTAREEKKERERLLRKEMRRAVPSVHALVNRLDQKDLLPAIFFIFSRAGCEEAARSVCRFIKGPTDVNRRLLDDDADEPDTETFEETREETTKRKRKTRQRGQRRKELLKDSEGRTFRPSGSFITEDTLLSSLYDSSVPLLDEFDESSPLSSENWDFYSKAGLLTYDKVQEVASRISLFNEENEEIAFDEEIMEQYLFGVGSHHAGMLPAHKTFVEILFRNKLMKVVFATETLAAGINMPARTTVICALAKRGDTSSMNLLETSNLLQMAGRAGRRGIDTDGTCVIVATPFETHDDAAKILTDPIKPISSQFRPSFSLAVNLIARGEGKLMVARQLVSKSFAMWEKKQAEENVLEAVDSHRESVQELLEASAQEKFMSALVEIFQLLVDRRSAKFDNVRIQSLLDILNDREALKKTSKSFIGAEKILGLELTTLGYLEKEYAALRDMEIEDEQKQILGELLNEDEQDLIEQIEIQRKRTIAVEKQVLKHPFSAIASVVNILMEEDTPEASILRGALESARKGQGRITTGGLSAEELSVFSKSAIVIQRKTRKLASTIPDLDPDSLLQEAGKAEATRDNSWDDFLSITKTLVAYGCLTTDADLDDTAVLEESTFHLTPAGLELGMLGFENSLWCLVAVGGSWDVIGASAKLDEFRDAMDTSDQDETDWYDNLFNDEKDGDTTNNDPTTLLKPQREAFELVSLLKSLSASELAGYVSSLVSENFRDAGISVIDRFQRLTLMQQRVVQSSLLAMERLSEVQKLYSVDERTRDCTFDISNCEVVTAWADGCTWSEALEISGAPPGDLARTLSRVLDALRQLGNLPYKPLRRKDVESAKGRETVSCGLHPEVRKLCREAATAINRYPVKDPLIFEMAEEDDDDTLNENEELLLDTDPGDESLSKEGIRARLIDDQ